MTVIGRVDDGQSLSVVAVSVCAQLMLDLMRLEVSQPADFQYAVFCHGGIPHQIAAGLDVVDVFQQTAHVDDCVAHDRQSDIIGHIVFI